MNNVKYLTTVNSKFKTTHVSFKFETAINKDVVANGIVLNELMVMSSKKYNTIKKFNEMLYDLYDMRVTSGVSQKGLLYIFEVNFSFITSEYLPEDINASVVDFMNEVLLHPNLENEEYIENVKKKRILELETIYDDKLQYTLKKVQNLLDTSQTVIVDVNSDIDSINNVTKASLEQMYQKLFEEANITIAIDGRNCDEIKTIIDNKITFNATKHDYKYFNAFKIDEHEEFISESQNLSQSKFVIGSKLDVDKADFSKFQVFNAIYGAFPFSRLFTNIREKQSLAYSIASSYVSTSNVMYIYGGIGNGDLSVCDSEAFSNVLGSLKSELASICNGEISDIEMEQAKSMIINSITSSLDTQRALQEIHYLKYLAGDEFDFEKFVEGINNVTKEDVMKMAKKVNFNIIYMLRGDK